MLKYFRNKQDKQMVNNFLSLEGRERMLEKLTTLQNEISVSYNNKVIVITSLEYDELAAAFAKAFADAFVKNGSSALLVDANLYEPHLGKLLSVPTQKLGKEETKLEVNKLSDKLGVVCLDKVTYPAEAYKSGLLEELIEANKETYEHVVILMPSVKKHKEVSLLSKVLDSVLLLCRRDVSTKGDIFYALQYLAGEHLPVSKTVILK